MIVFEYIKYKNLLASGNYWTEISLNSKPNTCIIGKNGHGKSTLLDALCFVLFGKAFRNIPKASLVNSINQKNCVVEIGFSTNNKSYKIVRGIKPNIFEIYCNGVMIEQESNVKDYQEFLEKSVLKFNFKSFTQIVILGSASFVPFMQLSPADRRIIIEDLLDIQIFTTMNNIIKNKMSLNKESILENKSKVDLLEQQYRLEKLRFDGMNKDNTDRINGLKDDIKNIMVKIEGSKEKLKLFEDRVKELDGYLTGKKDVENLIYSHTKNESVIENNISTIKKELKFLTSNDTCPTCKQSIDDKFKNDKIETLNLKIKELTDKLETEKSNILKYKKLMDGFREIEGKIQKNKVSMASIKTSILEGENYIKKINSQIKSLQKVVDDDVKDEKVLNEIMVEIESEQKNYKKLLSERQYFDTISMLLKDSGIKTQIIKQYLPLINKIVNKHLVALDFFVNFNLDDNFKETIKSRHRDDFVYNNFSEGEKSRINLSLLFAWREIAKLKNSNHTNLLILDEIFDSSLDNIGIDYLLNILQSTEGVNNFIISHKGDVLFDKFDRVIEFEKKKNFSKMKVLQ